MPTQASNHDPIEELLGAYALGAVSPEERGQIEAHLPSCGRCRKELADHMATIADLARVAAELGPERVARLMDVPGADRPGVGGQPSTMGGRRLPGGGVLAVLGVAVLLLVGLSALAVGSLTQRRLNRVEARLARAEQIELVVDQAAGRDTRTAHLTSGTAGVSLDVIVLGDGRALVWKSRLPAPGPQRSYVLWALVAGRPVPIGPLDPAGKSAVVAVPAAATGLLATDEASHGTPEGTRIVVSGALSGTA